MSIGRIRLELIPWVTTTCGYNGPGRLILEETIEEGATTGALLRKMAAEHKAFKEAVFDPSGEKLSGRVSIVLNGRFLDLLEGLDNPVKDSDTIMLFPVIDGG